MSKITNSKHQITNKSQIPIFNDQNIPGRDIVWIFEFRSPARHRSRSPFRPGTGQAGEAGGLEIVWYLSFDICNFDNSMNLDKANPLGG